MTPTATATAARTAPVPEGAGARPVVLYVRGPFALTSLERQLEALDVEVVVTSTSGISAAAAVLRTRPVAVALVHLTDDRAALAMVRALRGQVATLPIAGLIDATRSVLAADAFRAGVADLLTLPLDERDLAAIVANAADRMA